TLTPTNTAASKPSSPTSTPRPPDTVVAGNRIGWPIYLLHAGTYLQPARTSLVSPRPLPRYPSTEQPGSGTVGPDHDAAARSWRRPATRHLGKDALRSWVFGPARAANLGTVTSTSARSRDPASSPTAVPGHRSR